MVVDQRMAQKRNGAAARESSQVGLNLGSAESDALVNRSLKGKGVA
jgi:hypothetical protein